MFIVRFCTDLSLCMDLGFWLECVLFDRFESFCVFWMIWVRGCVAVLRCNVVFLDTALAVSEFSVILCIVDGLELLFRGVVRMA